MSIQSGKLRDMCTIQKRVTSRDAHGAATRAWEVVANDWCDVHHLSGAEITARSSTDVMVSHRVVMRWRPDIATGYRILTQDDGVLQIEAIPGSRQSGRISCICRSVTDGDAAREAALVDGTQIALQGNGDPVLTARGW